MGVEIKKQLLIVGIIILLVCVGLSGCGEKAPLNFGTHPNDTVPHDDTNEIQILSYYISERGESIFVGQYMKVFGSAKNIDQTAHTVQITGVMFDENHSYLCAHSWVNGCGDDRYSGINNWNVCVPAGTTWNFELYFSGDNVQYARSVEVTARCQ